MKKLNIVGLISEKKKVLDVLRSSGWFELTKINSMISGQKTGEGSLNVKLYEDFRQKLQTVYKAITESEKISAEFKSVLKEYIQATRKRGTNYSDRFNIPKQKKQLFFYREQVSAEELNEVGMHGNEIFDLALRVIAQAEHIEAINNEYAQNEKELIPLQPYRNVDVRLSDIRDTTHLFMLIGMLNKPASKKALKEYMNKDGYSVRYFPSEKKRGVFFVSGPIGEKRETEEFLSYLSFSKCELDYELTASEAIKKLEQRNQAIYDEKLEIYHTIASNEKDIKALKLYYDFIELELEAMDAQKQIGETKMTYSIEGWVPAEKSDALIEQIKAVSACVECELLDVRRDDEPPTLVRSSALVAPYQSVTNMFSPPSPHERDPNPFVAIFFFVFFGIMTGDAVYGLALFALTFILLKCYKMDSGLKKLMMILCMGGVSAFIWGAVYNSWAAVGLPYNPLLNPVEHPFDFLIISLGLGYAQIIFGFLLRLVANIRRKDYMSALADSGWKLLIMFGGMLNFPLMLDMFENQFLVLSIPSFSDTVYYVGLGMVLGGLFGMLLTGGRNKDNIARKIASGFGSWYDLVGILSDILSYCRLFGLALSSAIIGMVANILAKDVLFHVPILGYPLGIAVSVFFHVFNLALACLGAYVHNARLQFVEFFGKFYEGGGRLFKPMGHCTKYTTITRQ